MSSSNLVKWGGILAVTAGLAYIGLVLFDPLGSPQLAFYNSVSSGSLGTLILFPVTMLGRLAGIAGLHALLKGRYGRLGTVGTFVAFVGVAAEFIVAMGGSLVLGTEINLEQLRALLGLFFVSLLTLFVGLVFLGLATMRTRSLPRWGGLLLIFGMPVTWLLGSVIVAVQPLGTSWGPYASGLGYGVFWVLVGYLLLSRRQETP